MYCLTHYGDRIATATGVTLSQRQLDAALERAQELGFAEKVDFRLENYRDTTGTFDRVVGIGVAEHVGFKNMAVFTQKIHDLLEPNGRGLLHLIVAQREQSDEPGGWARDGSQFIRERIFPGGQVPLVSYMAQWIEESGLTIEHKHLFGYYYHWTLTKWYQNFCRNRDKIEGILVAQGFSLSESQKIIQQYKLYLAGCAIIFEQGFNGIAQFTLNKEGLVRDDEALEKFMSGDDA